MYIYIYKYTYVYMCDVKNMMVIHMPDEIEKLPEGRAIFQIESREIQ